MWFQQRQVCWAFEGAKWPTSACYFAARGRDVVGKQESRTGDVAAHNDAGSGVYVHARQLVARSLSRSLLPFPQPSCVPEFKTRMHHFQHIVTDRELATGCRLSSMCKAWGPHTQILPSTWSHRRTTELRRALHRNIPEHVHQHLRHAACVSGASMHRT